jgi:hypothetical protein
VLVDQRQSKLLDVERPVDGLDGRHAGPPPPE